MPRRSAVPFAPPAELFRALAVLAEPPGPSHERVATALGLPRVPGPADHTEVFVLQCHPYASVNLGPDGMLGGDARDRVAGFWRALGWRTPNEPDHLTALLGLYATLAEVVASEPEEPRRERIDRARLVLLWEHLLPWVPPLLSKIAELSPEVYGPWADLTLDSLLAAAGDPPDERTLPPALREAPGPPDPDAGGREFLTALLAPVRSGMILTRADLARGARRTGVGLRLGERRFVLGAMLDQDPAATLGWLALEADGWSGRHARHAAALGAIAGFWAERARSSAAVLAEAASACEVIA